ncbi:serine/threonine-protein kinase [Dactylosporangium sp. NPDC000521]|uniref:serine/threonine-protein kinase n=1 Tax=Dactylosporangium sp. NPDC000521 TaxID=3363975 RepID=UPI0036BF5360
MLGGRYRLEEQLGSGGMAVVWAATDEVLGRAVAVKMLNGAHTAKPDSLRRIRAEARAAANLSHPNIAQVHDYGEASDDGELVPYVVMELVPGPTLAQRIAAGPVEPKAAFRICAEIAAALTAAHAASLVHRDIKPANVIVTPGGAKVVDFGIAASVSPGGDGDLPDQVLGTPSYLAPERLTDDAIEPASDVYALGVILYKLLAGHLPWTVDSTTQVLTAHVYVPPTPLPETPGVPPEIADLCLRCLRKEPAQRPDAPEVAAALAAAAGLQVVPSTPALLALGTADGPAADGEPSALVIPPAPARQSRARVTAAAGVGAVSVAAILAWAALGSPPDASGRSGDLPSRETSRSAAAPAATGPAGTGAARPGGTGPAGTGAARPGGTSGAGGTPGTAATAGPGPTGSGGDGTDPAPTTGPPPPPTTSDPPRRETLSSAGGTVTAACDGAGRVRLTSPDPADGHKVAAFNGGPASTAEVTFKRGNVTIRMSVTCDDGVPTATTTTTTTTG